MNQRPKPGAGRIALGILTAVITCLITIALLPFTICFVAIGIGNKGQSSMFGPDAGGVFMLVLSQVLIPTLGLWLTVVLLRGREPSGAATDQMQPMVIPAGIARPAFSFSQDAFNWMRGLIGAYIALDVLERVVNPLFVSALMRRVMYGNWTSFAIFALYLVPYVAVLVRSWRVPDKFSTTLAVAYPAAGVCWSAYIFAIYHASYRTNLVNLFELFLNSAFEVVIAIVAWRVVRSLNNWSGALLAGLFAASLAYLVATGQLANLFFVRLAR